eukprot:4385954-Pyramimonas_sp.AAC.1
MSSSNGVDSMPTSSTPASTASRASRCATTGPSRRPPARPGTARGGRAVEVVRGRTVDSDR